MSASPAASDREESFIVAAATTLDKTAVGREDGKLKISRPLADGVTDTEDIHQLAFEHGLEVRNAEFDTDAQEIRVWIHDADNGGDR